MLGSELLAGLGVRPRKTRQHLTWHGLRWGLGWAGFGLGLRCAGAWAGQAGLGLLCWMVWGRAWARPVSTSLGLRLGGLG